MIRESTSKLSLEIFQINYRLFQSLSDDERNKYLQIVCYCEMNAIKSNKIVTLLKCLLNTITK